MSFNQEVNLYLSSFRKVEVPFSAKTIMQGCLVIIVALAAIYAFANIQLTLLRSTLDNVNEEEINIKEQVMKLEAQKNSRKSDKLYQEIEKLKVDLDARQSVVNRLGNYKGANIEGFSGFMKALARQHLQGMWLTEFSFSSGGAKVSIHGRTVEPALVPSYISKLKKEPAFANSDFGLFTLDHQGAKAGEVIHFSLGEDGKKRD